jgi:hypothetical protein
MSHKPHHPDNPYNLPEQQQAAAKVWELLRRNDRFRRLACSLQRLDQRARKEDQPLASQAWNAACRLLRVWQNRHDFAAVALQWLVPEPLFTVHRWRLPPDLDLRGTGVVTLDCVEEGEGTTPDPADTQWRWGTASDLNHRGRRIRRGPELTRDEYDDPRLSSRVDEFADWRGYAWPFTVDHSWRQAPPGFCRASQYLWMKRDSRAMNPVTGARDSLTTEHETNLFADWDLGSAFGATAQSGLLDKEAFVRCLMFEELADRYRVFAFPRNVRTRTEARRLAAWLVDQLSRLPDGTELPRHEKTTLGTTLQWDMLLVYEQSRREGAEHSDAVRHAFDILYIGSPLVRRKAEKPEERTLEAGLRHVVAKKLLSAAESTRWHSWMEEFTRMHSPVVGTGLVQRIFPGTELILPTTGSLPDP